MAVVPLERSPVHRVEARLDGVCVGSLEWSCHSGFVQLVEVREDLRRRGIATELWFRALRASREHSWRAPRHSTQRSPSGDAWARSVGGLVPEVGLI